MRIAGVTALVTGGAQRLGRAIAMALAREGVDIAVHYRTSEAEAARTVRDLRTCGVRAEAFRADLALPDESRALAHEVAQSLGPWRILVNNASRFVANGPASLSLDDVRVDAAIHLEAPLILSQALDAQLPDGDHGAIVNLLDHRAVHPDPRYASYSLAKASLGALTSLLAQSLAPRIRVNAISPGAILPPPELDAAAGREHLERVAARTPLERPGTEEDIAAACLFLVRDADFTTGTTIPVDGGKHLR
ncbi:MAG: SDR family oxidoreductase [Planctomycetes bacterium]|nr:SDR family oxidoreductase [Planctomycetota bacterium]